MPIRQSRAAGKDMRVAVPPRNMNSGVRPSKGDGSNLINTRNSAMDTRTRARQQTKQQQQQQQKHPRQQRQNLQHQAANGRAYGARPLRMSQWLKRLLDSGEVSGLRWENRARMEFSICWVHKSNHNFDQATHSDIFSRYAEYRGQTPKCFSTNKASFRCALNSLRDVQQLTKEGAKRGPNATRTFRFLSPSDPQYGKNRMKNNSSNPKKGRKRMGAPPRKSPSSSTSSWSSTVESASLSPPPSPQTFSESDQSSCSSNHIPDMSHSQPRPMPSVYFPPTPDKTIELYNVPTTLQGQWTTNILQPLEERMADALDITSRDEENCEMAKVTFMTSPAGITSVSAPMTGNLSPPPEVKFEFKDESLPMRVQVEPDIQSGGVVKGLPNFLELGVSDTYTPEEILVNKELVCGGEVRMKEERSFALPIFIDMTQFIRPSAKNNAQQDQIDSPQDPVCTSQESGSPSYFPSLPQSNQQATFVPQQYSETEQMQSDFELGQTLEISDGSYCNQDQYSTNSKYNTFTPQEDDERPYLEENNCAEPTDIKGCPLPVSTAYSNAVKTILNDVLLTCNTFKCSVRDPYTGTIPESPEPQQAVETRHAQVARVEIQVIEQADSLPLPDLPEEDLPDLFEIGSM